MASNQRRRWLGPAHLGLLLGASFGLWNLISTRLDPLADDTATALFAFHGPMFTCTGGFLGRLGRAARWADAKEPPE